MNLASIRDEQKKVVKAIYRRLYENAGPELSGIQRDEFIVKRDRIKDFLKKTNSFAKRDEKLASAVRMRESTRSSAGLYGQMGADGSSQTCITVFMMPSNRYKFSQIGILTRRNGEVVQCDNYVFGDEESKHVSGLRQIRGPNDKKIIANIHTENVSATEVISIAGEAWNTADFIVGHEIRQMMRPMMAGHHKRKFLTGEKVETLDTSRLYRSIHGGFRNHNPAKLVTLADSYGVDRRGIDLGLAIGKAVLNMDVADRLAQMLVEGRKL